MERETLRTRVLFGLSRRLLPKPQPINTDYATYDGWRHDSLSDSWSRFSDDLINGKEVLDFGCGDGQLSVYLSQTRSPKRVVGIDISMAGIERAKVKGPHLEWVLGTPERMPLPDRSFDTILAFDCMEHVMQPLEIIKDWFRVLRPGGKVVIEWYPFRAWNGSHMENLVPLPWAHIIFGEYAMMRTAEKIYDLPEFPLCHWDRDENGNKLPNKWRRLSSFKDGNFLNELTVRQFLRMVKETGFEVSRFDTKKFGGSKLKSLVGGTLMRFPLLGEYFVSHYLIELRRPMKPSPVSLNTSLN